MQGLAVFVYQSSMGNVCTSSWGMQVFLYSSIGCVTNRLTRLLCECRGVHVREQRFKQDSAGLSLAMPTESVAFTCRNLDTGLSRATCGQITAPHPVN